MATYKMNEAFTLLEQAKRTHNGDILTIAEILHESNEIMKDAVTVEANDQFSHVSSIRSKLPTAGKHVFNKGSQPSNSVTNPQKENAVLAESWAEIDVKLLKGSADPKKQRMQESKAHIEALTQQMVDDIIYGTVLEDGIDGLFTRYNALSLANVSSALGDASDGESSVLIVQWGVDTFHLFYPKGSSVGVERTDHGIQVQKDSSGNILSCYVDEFSLGYGINVKDARAVQRVCNIDLTNDEATLDDNLHRYMLKAISRLPKPNGQGIVIYCNREVKALIDIIAMEKLNGFYTADNIFGQNVTMFRGVPIRMLEGMINTEAVVS